MDLDSKYNNTLTYETISGRKTYQVIAGGGWEELLSNYTSLTGRQPLPQDGHLEILLPDLGTIRRLKQGIQ